MMTFLSIKDCTAVERHHEQGTLIKKAFNWGWLTVWGVEGVKRKL